jgi:hypothetical protein
MGLLACVLLGAVLFVLAVVILPRFRPELRHRTQAFRHGEPWIASAAWGVSLVILFLALGGSWQSLPAPLQVLAAPIVAPSPAATGTAPSAGAPATTAKPATVTAKPSTAKPSTAKPAATPLPVAISDASYGRIKATTAPGAACTARVVLPDGTTVDSHSLTAAKTAATDGKISWSYNKGSGQKGAGSVTVACSLHGRSGSATAGFKID